MSKRLLSTALAAVIATAGLASTAQAASSGTISISGKVLADTCTVSVNGGSTVTLPVVMSGSFSAKGDVAGTTSFNVGLTGCDKNTASAQMAFSGSNIDSTTGDLVNAATGGSNVQVQLLNSADAPINTSDGTNAPNITVTDGDGTTTLKAQYIATDALTSAGPVSTSVNFTLTYL